MICSYCGNPAELVTGAEIYPHLPRLADKSIWQCRPCDARVGCHPRTTKPLGILANAELRAAKSAAHRAFDPLWQAKMARDGFSKKKARSAAYAWLAEQLGIAGEDCHIGMFDVAMCRRVVEICASVRVRRREGHAAANEASDQPFSGTGIPPSIEASRYG